MYTAKSLPKQATICKIHFPVIDFLLLAHSIHPSSQGQKRIIPFNPAHKMHHSIKPAHILQDFHTLKEWLNSQKIQRKTPQDPGPEQGGDSNPKKQQIHYSAAGTSAGRAAIPWHFNRNANSMAESLSLSNLPGCEKWPAPRSHLNSRRLSFVFVSRSFATYFAGSLHPNKQSTMATYKENIVLNDNTLVDFAAQSTARSCKDSTYVLAPLQLDQTI